MNSASARKVVFVLPALTAGGAERVLITLMNGISRDAFEPHFMAVDDRGPLRDLIDPSISFHALQKRKVSLALPFLYKRLRSVSPDIVVSTMAHMNFALLLMKPFFPGTKFIVREAITPTFIINEHPFAALPIKAAYKLLYPAAERVLSPAQVIIDEFQSSLGMSCKNHVLLPNPVDVQHIRAQAGGLLPERRAGAVRFIAAGRLHPQKGFDRLIGHMPAFRGPGEWHLTIFGEGPERPALEALIREKGLEGRVELPGLSGNPWPHYAAADCFLLPSRHEGLPNVVLESLACGTPVIATKESGGIAEIAENAPSGAVTIADDMNSFVRAMESIRPADPLTPFRPSLLPSCYERGAVIKRFEDILSGLS